MHYVTMLFKSQHRRRPPLPLRDPPPPVSNPAVCRSELLELQKRLDESACQQAKLEIPGIQKQEAVSLFWVSVGLSA